MMGKGIIKISGHMYRDRWDICWQIFKEFRPTHIHYSPTEYDTWVFCGESEHFDTHVSEGEIPVYDVLLTMDDDKRVVAEFRKL